MHGIRILPGPSSLWLDARGRRLPVPLFPGFDTMATLAYLRRIGYDWSWFVLTRKVIEREFALSGSEQNPDLTSATGGRCSGARAAACRRRCRRSWTRARTSSSSEPSGAGAADERSRRRGADRCRRVAAGARGARPRGGASLHEGRAGDGDPLGARKYLGDRLIRTAKPHRLLDPAAGPLIAVRLSVLTRKTLGGLETDLSGRVLVESGEPLGGLYAAGEAAGFGGGGMHGYRSLEGTFLGGCMFSGRVVGRAVAKSGLRSGRETGDGRRECARRRRARCSRRIWALVPGRDGREERWRRAGRAALPSPVSRLPSQLFVTSGYFSASGKSLPCMSRTTHCATRVRMSAGTFL